MENNNEVEELTPMETAEKPPKKKHKVLKVLLIVIGLIIIIVSLCYLLLGGKEEPKKASTDSGKVNKAAYRMSGNGLEAFDLYFLQLENEEKNKVYSPISIKYALEMLSEGSIGETKEQLDSIIGDYKAKSYPNSNHMSFANAMFINNTFKDAVKKDYINNLKEKYNAEVIYDEFTSPDSINNWVSEKTFKLINNLVDDVSNNDFFLINALAIDMNWNNQVHCASGSKVPCVNNGYYTVTYQHERLDDENTGSYHAVSYPYDSEEYFYGNEYQNIKHEFNGKEKIKGADILVDYNKYDIIKELGEEKIREIVKPEYEKGLQTEEGKSFTSGGSYPTNSDEYLDIYIEEIKANYGKGVYSTDFLLYEDDNVKTFAKDLQEYDGITLQYVGIMPKTTKLADYIKDLNKDDLNNVINNLKEVKIENFKEGYATRIRGYIPFFKFEYQLQLMKDLKKLGITNIFDEKADLSNLTSAKGTVINEAIHKATIEFSNDGIKASAATAIGGLGAASAGFDYAIKIPVEDIDISFNNPYMYIIRDKSTGEIWFAGTVYEPIAK